MKRWEYIELSAATGFEDRWRAGDRRWSSLIGALNELGDEGWECAGIYTVPPTAFVVSLGWTLVYLKRQKEEGTASNA